MIYDIYIPIAYRPVIPFIEPNTLLLRLGLRLSRYKYLSVLPTLPLARGEPIMMLLCHLLLLQSVISEIHARSRVLQTGGPSPWTIRLSTSSHASLLREFLIISSPQQIPSYVERPEAEPPAAEVQEGPPSQFFISAQFPLIRL